MQRRIVFPPPPPYDLMGWKIIMMKSQLAQPSRVTEPELTTPQPPSPRSKGVVLDRPGFDPLRDFLRARVKLLPRGSKGACDEIMAFFPTSGNVMPEIVEVVVLQFRKRLRDFLFNQFYVRYVSLYVSFVLSFLFLLFRLSLLLLLASIFLKESLCFRKSIINNKDYGL